MTDFNLNDYLRTLSLSDQELVTVEAAITRRADRVRPLVEQYTPGVTDSLDVDARTAILDFIVDLLALASVEGVNPTLLLDNADTINTAEIMDPDDITLAS